MAQFNNTSTDAPDQKDVDGETGELKISTDQQAVLLSTDKETMSRVMDLEILESNGSRSSPTRMEICRPLPSSPSLNPFSPPPMAGIYSDDDNALLSGTGTTIPDNTTNDDTPVPAAVDVLAQVVNLPQSPVTPVPQTKKSTPTFIEVITILSDDDDSEPETSRPDIAKRNKSFKKIKLDSRASVEEITILSSDTEFEVDNKTEVESKEAWKMAPKPPKSSAATATANATTKLNEIENDNAVIDSPPETSAQLHDMEKQQKILLVEELINERVKEIKRLEEQEVDWDNDEKNSSYMMRYRLIKKCIENYNLLCDLNGCSKKTGREIQKPIKLENVTRYPLMDKKVQDFINSAGFFKGADFSDILGIVESCNIDLKLELKEEVLHDLANLLHVAIIDKKQLRRKLDELLVIPNVRLEQEDPAENDPDLRAKLRENDKKATSISSVVEKFAKKATEVQDDVQSEDEKEMTDEEVDYSRMENGIDTESDEEVAEQLTNV